jgi:hypothetical protein
MLMGRCTVFRECDVPPIRARLLTIKGGRDQRAIIMVAMQHLSEDRQMDFNNKVYFSDKTIESQKSSKPRGFHTHFCIGGRGIKSNGLPIKNIT